MQGGSDNASTIGDEILVWQIVAPGDVVEGSGGPLFNPSVSYPVVLVPANQPQDPQYAIEHGVIGKIGNGERTEHTVTLRNVQPLCSYHIGYKEDAFWHWVLFTIPLRLRPMQCTDRTVSVHLDYSHHPDVAGVRTLITTPSSSKAYRKEREYDINDLPIDEDTGLQVVSFRSLVPCCAYFIEAWPIFSDGTHGSGTLKTRVVTQAEVVMFFQEIGDTYLRIGFRRPPLRPPFHTGVCESDAHVAEYVLQLWEDPTESLLKNATRLSRGRQPQRYPLRKSEVVGHDLPCGVTQVLLIDRLTPNTPHFITLQTRGPVAEAWDPRILRVRVKTCAEVQLPIEPARLTSSSINLAWVRHPAVALPFCDLAVDFPQQTNLFSDRDVPNPYIGSRVVELPDGNVWHAPTVLSAASTSGNMTTAKLGEDQSNLASNSFELSVTDVSTSTTRIVQVRKASSAHIKALTPSTTYILKVRSIPIPLSNTRGNVSTPWSRPYVFMTPSTVLCRDLHRTQNAVTVAWGRHTPTAMMPLDFEPGRFKYLPDCDATSESQHYYYLEPLPFLCGDAVDQADLSESEDEAEVYADGCITGSGIGYLGKRSRIINRAARPDVVAFPCIVDPEEYTCVTLVLFGERKASEGGDVTLSVGTPRQTDLARNNSTTDTHSNTMPPTSLTVITATRSSMSEPTHEITGPALELLKRNYYMERCPWDCLNDGAVLGNGMTCISMVVNAPASGIHTFTGLHPDCQLRLLCFYRTSESAFPRLQQEVDSFTLPANAKMSPRNGEVVGFESQMMWSTFLCDVALQNDRRAFIDLEEVSEVFVTLRIGRRRADECQHSLHLALLESNTLDHNAYCEADDTADNGIVVVGSSSEVDADDHSADDDSDDDADGGASSLVEYLLRVEQVEVVDGVRTVVGEPRAVYLCTAEPVVQLVDLTAASRFEVAVATMSPRLHQWTSFSESISFTTVQKLLFELEEISTEYINLKWGRSRLDNIRDYSLQITDLSAKNNPAAVAAAATSPPASQNKSEAVSATTSCDDPFPVDGMLNGAPRNFLAGASFEFVKGFAETQCITTHATHYRLDTQRDLRANAVFDCMVVPHYVNGQRGLYSNVLRFLQCSLLGSVVEAGVAHLRLEWTPPPLHEMLPTCEATANNSGDDASSTIVSVCLIRLRNAARTWERTVQCNPAVGYLIFEGLAPETHYDAHIAMIALLPRCNCCVPPDPCSILQCCEPFSLSGETLTQPSARVSRVWEDAVEIEWRFESEPNHVGDVELELRFTDRKHAEDTSTMLHAEANGKDGRGAYVVRDLNPGRSYSAQLRQRYNRGTWGEWRRVLDAVKTLPKLMISLQSIAETAFRIRALREPFDCSVMPGMEEAVQEHPNRYRFKVELLSGQRRSSLAQKRNDTTDLDRTIEGADVSINSETPQTVVLVPRDEDGGEPEDDDQSITFVETTATESFISGLEANTPYRVTAQQWSLDDWGAPSQPIHSYTLNNMVPTMTRRCDSYFEVHCARDKRLPLVSTVLCTPHNEASTVQYSRLVGVTLTATSLISGIMTTRFLLPCTESSCSTLVGRVVDLESSHPYRVDVRTEYEHDEVCPHVTSLATITASVPVMRVAALGEDFVSILIDRKSVVPSMAQAHDAFHSLPSSVRHAANEGLVVDILEYQFTFEPIQFDDDDDVLPPQVFQDPAAKKESICVPSSVAAVTKSGLMSEIPYNVFLHTVDERRFSGREHLIGAVSSRGFPKIFVNKLSENFAEIEWKEEEEIIGEDHTVATVSGAISKRFGRWARIPPVDGYNLMKNGNPGDEYEFIIAEDIEVPDPTRPATRTAIEGYKNRCSLVEQLNPETQYFVVGRCRRTVPTEDGGSRTYLSGWGAPTRFATLALLVLRVVHCSLDFANVAWQDPVSMSPVVRTSHLHGPGNLTQDLWGSTTMFTKKCVEASADGCDALTGGSAQAVRFQLRLMHATPEGDCGAVIQDMFVVTNDGIHTIEHLIPGKPYAVSMRVCYEGLSGSWVAPAVFRSDRFPEPRYLSLTRRDVEMELDLELGGELREGEEFQVPDRNHRLFEVVLNDSDYVRYVIVKVHEPTRLYIAGLRRGRRYRAAIREVINGTRYGEFVHLCAFWMQPYPPIITRLLECRDGFCELEWRVIECKAPKDKEDEEDLDFVYQLEQGVRSAKDPTVGEHWKEVVITDVVNHRFKWTERFPKSVTASGDVPFSQLCFRVRASKCFVLQNGLSYKSPVWGDWSLVAYWNEAQPPHPVTRLTVAYCSDTLAIAKWELPQHWEQHPGLRFIVKIRPVEPHPAAGAPATSSSSNPTSPIEAGEPSFQQQQEAWFTVGTTDVCAAELPKLAKATIYMVAVQSESSFGVNPKMTAVSFTTRYVPNTDPKPSLLSVAPRALIPAQRLKALLLPGLRPVDPFESNASNLYDKYEEPKRLRLRAVIRMAGMLDRTKRGEMVQQRFQCLIRRLITTQKVVHRYAADIMMQPNFKPNEVYSPEQVARVRFGLDPDNCINTWTREFEEFLQSEQHQALRRTFTFHPDAPLMLPGTLLMLKKKKSSRILERRRIASSASVLRHQSARTPSPVAAAAPSGGGGVDAEEGVSWTTENPHKRRGSTGSMSQLSSKKSSIAKKHVEDPPQKTAPQLAIQCPSPLSVTPVTSPVSTAPSSIHMKQQQQQQQPKRKQITAAVRLPALSIRHPSAAVSPTNSLMMNQPERVGSVLPDDARATAPQQTSIDPPPMLPALMRNRLLAALQHEA